MAFCSSCGSQVEQDTRFCHKCGQPVAGAAPLAQAPPAPPATYAAQPAATPPVYAAAPPVYAPITPQVPAARYAGFWLRVGAYLIDGIILMIPSGIIIFAIIMMMGGFAAFAAKFPQSQDPNEIAANMPAFISAMIGFVFMVMAILTVIQWLYFALMEASEKQGTLGKIIVGAYVTDMNGQRISFGRASGRYFAKFGMGLVPFGFIGYILAGFTEKKQALEDFIASTLVYRRN
jgi:uncharacterized RDD family membrane protein YckC